MTVIPMLDGGFFQLCESMHGHKRATIRNLRCSGVNMIMTHDVWMFNGQC